MTLSRKTMTVGAAEDVNEYAGEAKQRDCGWQLECYGF